MQQQIALFFVQVVNKKPTLDPALSSALSVADNIKYVPSMGMKDDLRLVTTVSFHSGPKPRETNLWGIIFSPALIPVDRVFQSSMEVAL